jgi:hypothetical protein
MHRRHYLLAFMALATAFVPILVNFGVVAFIVPTVWALGSAAIEIFSADWRAGIGFLIYSTLYLALFYGFARLTLWLFSLVRSHCMNTTLHLATLFGLFTCSFLPKITYSSIQGRGGTYTFWGAIDRYFERRHELLHPTPKTSADWQLSQISLRGEWYPSIALSGAAESLEDYLNRINLGAVAPRQLTVYLDDVLSEQILPEHQASYAAALDEIFARGVRIASARGITLRRGAGRGDMIGYRAGERDALVQHVSAEPKLAVTTHMGNGFELSITVTHIARTPLTRAHYGKDFRGPATFIDEELIPW